jgi:hypothetical protein
MQYTLSSIHGDVLCDIEQDTFEYLLSGKERVLAWLQVEEVFGYLVEAWCDMESQIHARCLRSHEASGNVVSLRARFFEDRATADRLLLNFLSATRMYLEHLKKKVPVVVGKGNPLATKVVSIRNAYRARKAQFVVADELRNIIQHEAHGVGRVVYSTALLSKPTPLTRVGAYLAIPLDDLSSVVVRGLETKAANTTHEGQRKRLWKEIDAVKALATPLEMRETMRHFCADLAEMHEETRDGVQHHVDEAIEVFAEAYHGEPITPEGERGAFVRAIDADGQCVREEWIGHAAVDRLKFLRAKYSGWSGVRDRIHGTPPGA